MADETRSWVEQLLDSSEHQLLYEQESLIMAVTEAVAAAMEERELCQARVAEAMGRSAAFVSQLLAGNRNMTLRSAAALAFACGVRLKVSPEPLSTPAYEETPIAQTRAVRLPISAAPVERHVLEAANSDLAVAA